MEYDEKKLLAHEVTKILIQNNKVTPVHDGYGNINFEIDGQFFTYSQLCHHFFIEIDQFESR